MSMELESGAGWSRDLAWGLFLIMLNVVFHAISLGLINKDVTSRLGGSMQRWHHVFLSVFVVGGTALSLLSCTVSKLPFGRLPISF
jgi:hypothetical protein